MKRAVALAIIAIFIFSLVPLAFAEQIEKREKVREKYNKEALKNLKEEQRAKIEALDKAKVARLSNLSNERLQKIAELDKRQIERLSALNIKNLEKIAELKKERLERISNLSQEKIERLSELEKEKLEKISDLNGTEIEKAAVLNRARLKELVKLDKEKLKAELKALRVVKVKGAGDLDRRNISEARLAQLRQKFEEAKEKFNESKNRLEDARKKLKEAKDKKDEKATLEHAKNYLLKMTDTLINHLEKIKAKVQESKNIQDDTEAKIVAEIDAQISELNALKAEVEAATTKEEIKSIEKKLRDKWNKLKHLINLHAEVVTSARVEGIVNQGLVLEKKLDKILEKAKEKGIEIDVSAEISQFSEKIATSKDKYKQAQAKLSEALDLRATNESADSEKIKTLTEEAKALLKEARDAIKEAHDILKTIVKKIKGAAPDADISTEVEVEVAEDLTSPYYTNRITAPSPVDRMNLCGQAITEEAKRTCLKDLQFLFGAIMTSNTEECTNIIHPEWSKGCPTWVKEYSDYNTWYDAYFKTTIASPSP